jgi:hypothetical protein
MYAARCCSFRLVFLSLLSFLFPSCVIGQLVVIPMRCYYTIGDYVGKGMLPNNYKVCSSTLALPPLEAVKSSGDGPAAKCPPFSHHKWGPLVPNSKLTHTENTNVHTAPKTKKKLNGRLIAVDAVLESISDNK